MAKVEGFLPRNHRLSNRQADIQTRQKLDAPNTIRGHENHEEAEHKAKRCMNGFGY